MAETSSSRSLTRWVSRVLAGATDIRPGEGRAVLASGLLFFLVLSAMMVLRPVREALGVEHGVEKVRQLFLCTVAVTLLLVPAFGYLVSRVRRRSLIAVSFRCCGLILLGFYLSLTWAPESVSRVSGAIYYVSYSVINLFVVSLFWAYMADLFSVSESRRLFPAIAIGGTLGAIAGSLVSEQWAQHPNRLFLLAVALLELAVWTSALVPRSRDAKDSYESAGGDSPIFASRKPGQSPGSSPATPKLAAPAEPQKIGGHPLAALVEVARSPYLLGVGAFILLSAMISTFFYLTGMRLVATTTESLPQRTVLFARINLWTQVATLLAQAFIAGRIMRFLGVGTALAVLPLCAAVGFKILAVAPTLVAYMWVYAAYRAVQRGIARPAQETLFTVVPREEKYKAKSLLDTFVFRAGDAGGAQIEGRLAMRGLGMAGMLGAVLPMALAWASLALLLGRSQSRLAGRKPDPPA